jgi:hypothetical protein
MPRPRIFIKTRALEGKKENTIHSSKKEEANEGAIQTGTVGMPVLRVGATIEHPSPPSLRGRRARSADASPLAATIAARAAGLRRMSSSMLRNML